MNRVLAGVAAGMLLVGMGGGAAAAVEAGPLCSAGLHAESPGGDPAVNIDVVRTGHNKFQVTLIDFAMPLYSLTHQPVSGSTETLEELYRWSGDSWATSTLGFHGDASIVSGPELTSGVSWNGSRWVPEYNPVWDTAAQGDHASLVDQSTVAANRRHLDEAFVGIGSYFDPGYRELRASVLTVEIEFPADSVGSVNPVDSFLYGIPGGLTYSYGLVNGELKSHDFYWTPTYPIQQTFACEVMLGAEEDPVETDPDEEDPVETDPGEEDPVDIDPGDGADTGGDTQHPVDAATPAVRGELAATGTSSHSSYLPIAGALTLLGAVSALVAKRGRKLR